MVHPWNVPSIKDTMGNGTNNTDKQNRTKIPYTIIQFNAMSSICLSKYIDFLYLRITTHYIMYAVSEAIFTTAIIYCWAIFNAVCQRAFVAVALNRKSGWKISGGGGSKEWCLLYPHRQQTTINAKCVVIYFTLIKSNIKI